MNHSKKISINEIGKYLSTSISDILLGLNDIQIEKLCEIRIRAKLPVVLIFTDSRQFITNTGRLTHIYSENLLCPDYNEIDRMFCSMCEYSVHSHNQTITNGFITLPNGCRVGVYGTAVISDENIKSVRQIRGLNIRIPGEFKGCSGEILDKCFADGLSGILICGPPSCGKTTLIKAMCRIISDEYQKKVAVIDERAELSSSYLGYFTDVLSSYPKCRGTEIAVRTLSPEIIVFDELGNREEVKSVIEAMNSGVKFISSIHCSGKSELFSKEQYKLLRNANAVDFCAFIDKNFNLSELLRVSDYENNCADNPGNMLCYDRTVHCIQI